MDIDKISPAPWARYDWTGALVSADGCDTADFTRDDVDEVIAFGTTPDGWDGDTAGIVRLKDGRFVAWEAMWGPTGDGFSCDAYGGTSDLTFALTEQAARDSLTEAGRDLLAKSTT